MILTGIPDLNKTISFYPKKTLIYGSSSSGKTCMCLQSTIEHAKKQKLIYLDTGNQFSTNRIKQLTDEKIYDNIYLFKIKSFKNQQLRIKSLKKFIEESNASLLILDSITNHYRKMLKNHRELTESMLKSQLRIIDELNIPTIITAEIYRNIKSNKDQVYSEKILTNWAELIIKLSKDPRKLNVIKPLKKHFYFQIRDKGIFQA